MYRLHLAITRTIKRDGALSSCNTWKQLLDSFAASPKAALASAAIITVCSFPAIPTESFTPLKREALL